MIGFFVDLMILGILSFCIWQGYRKGVIHSGARLFVLLIGIIVGAGIARGLTESIAQNIAPLGWLADEATDEAIRMSDTEPNEQSETDVKAISKAAFEHMGVLGGVTDKLTGKVWERMMDTGETLRVAISGVFVRTVCWVALFIFGFAVVTLALTLATHFVTMLLTLPPVPRLDRPVGIALGALYGLLLLFVLAWFVRFLGILLPRTWIDGTLILRLFVNVNPFGAIFF